MKFLKGSNKEKRIERVCAYPWSISRPLFKLFLFSCSYRSCSCCRRSSSRSRAMRSASLRRSWETRRPHSELKCNIKNIQTTLNFSQKPNCIHLFLWATAPARYGLSLFPASPAPGAPSPASVSPSPVSVAPAAGSLVLLAPAWYGRVHGVHVQQFLDALKKTETGKKGKQFPHEKSQQNHLWFLSTGFCWVKYLRSSKALWARSMRAIRSRILCSFIFSKGRMFSPLFMCMKGRCLAFNISNWEYERR